MEDLRDVGKNSLDAINKLGASDVGDLVLGIGDLIEELYDAPEDQREGKLEHLRGLFREFAHGEEYEFRDERLTPQEPEDPYAVTPGSTSQPNLPFGGAGYGALSGVIASGAFPLSGSFNPSSLFPPQPIVTGLPPHTGIPALDNPCGEQELEEDEEEVEPKPRPWWKPEISFRWTSEEVEEQLDDADTN